MTGRQLFRTLCVHPSRWTAKLGKLALQTLKRLAERTGLQGLGLREQDKETRSGSLLEIAAFASFITWINLAFRATVVPQFSFAFDFLSHPRMDEAWLAALAASPVGLLIVLALARILPSGSHAVGQVCSVVGALLMVGGTLPMTLFVDSLRTIVAGGFLCGLGMLIFLSCQLPLFLDRPINNLFVITVLGMALSALLDLVLLVVIQPVAMALLAALPLLSLACALTCPLTSKNLGRQQATQKEWWIRPAKQQPAHQTQQRAEGAVFYNKGKWHISRLMAVTLLLAFTSFSFCMGIIGFSSDTLSESDILLRQVGIMAGGALLAAIIIQLTKRLDGIPTLRFVILALLATATLLLPFSYISLIDQLTAIAAQSALLCAYTMLLFVVRDWTDERQNPDRQRLIAMTLTTIAVFELSGILAGGAIRSIFGFNQAVLGVAATIVLYLIFMVVLVLTRNRQKVEYVLTGAVANEDSIAQARSTILAERFPQLSNRELEVLPLMLQNYGNARMAKTLVVSENTVKTHVRHIYAKMGINTRQQLLELASGIKLAPNKP